MMKLCTTSTMGCTSTLTKISDNKMLVMYLTFFNINQVSKGHLLRVLFRYLIHSEIVVRDKFRFKSHIIRNLLEVHAAWGFLVIVCLATIAGLLPHCSADT
jgi:hypothetical protein